MRHHISTKAPLDGKLAELGPMERLILCSMKDLNPRERVALMDFNNKVMKSMYRRRLKQRSAVWFALFAWALVIFLAVHVKLAADTPGNPFAQMADELIAAMFGGK
jgi:hypothetical protein